MYHDSQRDNNIPSGTFQPENNRLNKWQSELFINTFFTFIRIVSASLIPSRRTEDRSFLADDVTRCVVGSFLIPFVGEAGISFGQRASSTTTYKQTIRIIQWTLYEIKSLWSEKNIMIFRTLLFTNMRFSSHLWIQDPFPISIFSKELVYLAQFFKINNFNRLEDKKDIKEEHNHL